MVALTSSLTTTLTVSSRPGRTLHTWQLLWMQVQCHCKNQPMSWDLDHRPHSSSAFPWHHRHGTLLGLAGEPSESLDS